MFWDSVAAEVRDPGMLRAVRGFVWRPGCVDGVNCGRRGGSAADGASSGVPVVLVHGALSNMGATWSSFGPWFAAAGVSVFAMNVGFSKVSCGGRLGGVSGVRGSVDELANFVDLVCDWSGSDVVDVVGHSAGALVGLCFVNAGGAGRVRRWVGVAPCLRGTVSRGLLSSARVRTAACSVLDSAGLSGLADVTLDSPFVRELWERFPSPAGGVDYVAVRSRFDRSVTPLAGQMLPDVVSGEVGSVTNVLLQDVFPASVSNHRTMTTDLGVASIVLEALSAESLRGGFVPSGRLAFGSRDG